MKKTLAIVLCISMLLGMLSMLSFADSATVVEKGSEWEYLCYEDTATEAPAGWATKADSETWESNLAPFSGTAYTNAAAVTTLPYGNFRCYSRQTFTLDAAATSATMFIKYDEQPVVYINGTQVWVYTENTATGNNYVDHMYVEVDLSAYADAFKVGENVIAIDWRNEFGGSVMDLQLDVVTGGDAPVVPPVVDDDSLINEDGTVKITGTESFATDGNPGQCPFAGDCACGNLGGVAHLYDGKQDSVWGWGDAGSIIATFKGEVKVTEIFLQTKNEGNMTDDTAPHGEYVVSFLVDGEWYELGVVQALIEGKTVAVENIEATAIKVEIKEWYNTNWRSIAELVVKGEEIEGGDVTPPVEPPVDPGEQPDTGDATVYAIVFAVVALMGMGVVVTKKVRA